MVDHLAGCWYIRLAKNKKLGHTCKMYEFKFCTQKQQLHRYTSNKMLTKYLDRQQALEYLYLSLVCGWCLVVLFMFDSLKHWFVGWLVDARLMRCMDG